MRTARVVVAVTSLLLIMGSTAAFGDCRSGCSQPPDGYIVCQAGCNTYGYCSMDENLDPMSYCYYDLMANVCHVGQYDPCCNPDCIGPF